MNKTILVVDDSPVERAVLSGFLRNDYNVIEVGSGEETIEVVSKKFNTLSTVIMDVVMPGMDGFETMQKIKANQTWQQLPIIITTSLDDDESREKAIINGADNFITKPYSRALLLYVVQNAIKLHETAAIANTLFRDSLTGLLSRDSFFTEAKRMIKRHKPSYYILSCLDIDNFKVINDQYGTEVGDKVLKHIANSLSGFVAGINGLTCRYTADKFAILYPAELKNSSSVKENHVKITFPDCISGSIHARIGRYLVNDLTIPVSAMFDRAAMAQDSIKNRYDVYIADYTDSMRNKILKEQQVVNNMNDALKKGEFKPWFQPQYNHATGALIGAEALARWEKDGKLIAPDEFISVFERNGFIYEMDKNIWEQVCALLRKWIDEGKNPLPVSINISRKDLFHAHFTEVLCGIVNKYKLPYELVRLEVTESAFTDSSIVEKVDMLIELGFTVEIDDFGSGYSSLNTLKDVPASILKLDMKFFEDTKNTERGGNIIESVVRMAKWLGMSIIAEGVEEKAQADYLKSIGCYFIQGYFYARPMPVQEYESCLKTRNKASKLAKLETLETLDNNEFWNPKSIETLIFNSYVGGACIFEYYNGKTELLRMNDQYTKEMGGLIPPGTQLIDASMARLMINSERKKLLDIIEKAIETKKEVSCEICISNGIKREYIRVTGRIIARTGNRYLCYGVILNVTADKEANEQLQFLNQIAHDILVVSDSEYAINDILKKILTYFDSERAYIMEDSADGKYISNTYEICADSILSVRCYRQKLVTGLSGRRSQNVVVINDTNTCEEFGTSFLNILSSQGVRSTIIIPLVYNGHVFGTLGIDNFKTVWNQIERYKVLGDYIAILLNKRDTMIQFDKAKNTITSLMDNTPVYANITNQTKEEEKQKDLLDNLPCGAALYKYDGNTITAVHINSSYWKLVGREPINCSQVSIFDAIYPEDRSKVEKEVKSAIKEGRNAHVDIRVLHGDGNYHLLRISACIMEESDGRYALFTSYNPITDQTKQLHEMSFELNTLLHTIPSGVFKYSADEKEEFAYINRNFVEELGYTVDSFREKFHNCFREMLWHEDREEAENQIQIQEGNGNIGKFDYRVEAADGTLHWFHDEGVKIKDERGCDWYYVTLVDITERKETENKLRLAEEEYRVATRQSGHTIGRYNIEKQTLSITEGSESHLDMPELISDVPYGRVKLGKISPETSDAYIAFYEDIMHGKKEGTVTFQKLLRNGWRWITEHSTTIFDTDGKPQSAIISCVDVTEHQEKEIAYKKWQQELESKKNDSFTLFRVNLNKNSSYDSVSGTLLSFSTDQDEEIPFNKRARDFAMQYVVNEDRERYIAFVNADAMLAGYYRGKRSGTIEFRARISNSKVHWLRLTIDLVEYPNSSDVEAYLMYDDINDSKVTELNTIEQAETDSLTGLLNRKTFVEKLNKIFSASKGANNLMALFIIDMDGFKQVNDNFGHSAGDQVLIDAGKAIRSIVYGGDLVCRLGGDEFLVCIRNMPNHDLISKKANQICMLTRRSFSFGVQLTISLGISVFPEDGTEFNTLYQKADKALYYIKKNGKNNCEFYQDIPSEEINNKKEKQSVSTFKRKKRMLIVDDSKVNQVHLKSLFKDKFIVNTLDTGKQALDFLNKYSSEVAIVILDLMMPEINGFTVLDNIRENTQTNNIPVIIVSGVDDRETNLRALRKGAYDFISKPVDSELLRIRVNSAIERSEIDYLRLQNEIFSIEKDEMTKIKKIFEDDGTIIVEYETRNKQFRYDHMTVNILSGTYDERPLWDIFENDTVSSKSDAEKFKEIIYNLIENENKTSESIVMELRTKSNTIKKFRVKVMRYKNDIAMNNNLLITFTDLASITK